MSKRNRVTVGRAERCVHCSPLTSTLVELAFACAEVPTAWAEPVDLELVLAVDVSRSINAKEGFLQSQGYRKVQPTPEDFGDDRAVAWAASRRPPWSRPRP